MAGVGWIMTIILGGLAGWIAEKIMKSDMGLIGNIILGIIGAVVLNAVLRGLSIVPPEGWIAADRRRHRRRLHPDFRLAADPRPQIERRASWSRSSTHW